MLKAFTRRYVLNGLGAVGASACTSLPPARVEEQNPSLYFTSLEKGGILINIEKRRLAYWAVNNTAYREFPIGVPSAPELERRGRTSIIQKRISPSWAPTPSMLRRNPQLPRYVAPGPGNPLGTHALYLGWKYYAVHGTNDPKTIGRKTTSGCFRLFSGHIKWLYDAVAVGTPVVVT